MNTHEHSRLAGFISLFQLTLRELARTRWPLILVLMVVISTAASGFAGALALEDGETTRRVVYAALIRIGVVGAYTLLAIANLVRDADDRLLELLLSRPVTRTHFVFSRYAGYVAGALLTGVIAALPLLGDAPAQGLAIWTLSLIFELILMTAAAFAFALGLGQETTAFAATCGFYLLSRSVSSLVLLADSPLLATGSAWLGGVGALTHAFGLLLPDLSRACDSHWLIDTLPEPHRFAEILAGDAIYAMVLLLVGLRDFRRRPL
jgi:ABC-type transport system involved in multi-copper enzyme maturation permease subunit